jgi:hypothetical protein
MADGFLMRSCPKQYDASGRNIASEDAVMPIPGSIVDQIARLLVVIR